MLQGNRPRGSLLAAAIRRNAKKQLPPFPPYARFKRINYAMQFMPIGPTSDRDASLTMKPSQEEYDAFYKAFGECFSAWSTVEINLLSIYIFLLKSSEYDAAAASFYSTIGFRAKLNMVKCLLQIQERQVKELAYIGMNLFI